MVLPAFEVGENITLSGVCRTHINKACGTDLFQLLIEILWYLMEGLGPVSMSTTEDGVRHIFQLVFLQSANPLDKVSSVVGRLPFVRGSDNHYGSICWELVFGSV